jgi:hypothetical protein
VISFTTGEKAAQFRRDKGMGGDWKVGMMKWGEWLRWLRQNLLNGDSLVSIDPAPNQGTGVEILRVLAEAEGPGDAVSGTA